MSLILDALRRAEAERRGAHAPGIHDLPATGTVPRHGLHPAWLAVAAAAAFLLAVLLWPSAPDAPAPEPEAAAAPASPAVADRARNPASGPSALASVPTSPEPTAETVRSLDDLLPAPRRPRPPNRTGSATPAVTAPQVASPQSPAPATADDTTDATATPDTDKVEASAAPTGAADAGDAPSAAPATAIPSQAATAPQMPAELLLDGPPVTPLNEMPADFRSDFPNIRVDVHVWNQDPARRFVLINLKRYREGMTTTEGLTIDEIQPSAIVFRFRGQRVLYALH